MGMVISQEVGNILHQVLGRDVLQKQEQGYRLPRGGVRLQSEQMTTFVTKASGQILSFEQTQWIFQSTEGWLLPLYWVVEVLKEKRLTSTWDNHQLTHCLQEKSSSCFNEIIQAAIPSYGLQGLLCLSLVSSEVNIEGIRFFMAEFYMEGLNKPLPELLAQLSETPWFTQTSANTWRFHPLFYRFLQSKAVEKLPQDEETCRKLILFCIDQQSPLEAEELLIRLRYKQDPDLAPQLYILGEVMARNGHPKKALTYYRSAAQGFGQWEDSLGILHALNAMGAIYLELGELEKAEAVYRQIKQEFPQEQWNNTFIPAFLKQSIPKLSVYCLGDLELFRRDERLDWKKWKRRKGLLILLYLILQPSHRAAKEEILELFWPNESPTNASNAYHVTIHAVRQALSDGLGEEIPYLGVERGAVYLNSELIAFSDVHEFCKLSQEGLRRGKDNPIAAIHALQKAQKLYRGNLLESFLYEEWIFPLRESLRNRYLEVLNHLAIHYTRQQNEHSALQLWQEILRNDSTNESAIREVMRLLAQQGQRTAALNLYKKLKQQLKQELDAIPESQTTDLYQELVKKVRVTND